MLLRAFGLIVLWFALLAAGAALLATHLPLAFIAFVVIVAGALAFAKHRSAAR